MTGRNELAQTGLDTNANDIQSSEFMLTIIISDLDCLRVCVVTVVGLNSESYAISFVVPAAGIYPARNHRITFKRWYNLYK